MSRQTDLLLTQFQVGDRVQIAPHLDRWMAGDRYGTVTEVMNHYVKIKMDASGQVIPVVPRDIHEKVDTGASE